MTTQILIRNYVTTSSYLPSYNIVLKMVVDKDLQIKTSDDIQLERVVP